MSQIKSQHEVTFLRKQSLISGALENHTQMGTDWIYHNIWRYFSLIDLIEKSIQLNTWLTGWVSIHTYEAIM